MNALPTPRGQAMPDAGTQGPEFPALTLHFLHQYIYE